jgi:uncharacterized protein
MVTRARGWSRFFIVALALHIPLFFYPILRLCQWLESPWWLTLAIFLPLGGSQIISRVYLRHNRSVWARWLRLAADFWLGISPLMVLTLLVFEIIVFTGFITAGTAALTVISVGLLCGLVGVMVAVIPVVKRIEYASPELKTPVRFVQITDVHIGSRSKSFLENVIYKINQLQPDFVCITGDFIDASDIHENELRSLKSLNCPVYFCTGNHEKYEDLDEILNRLTRLGVKVLRNATQYFRDDLQVIGVDDMEDRLQVKKQLQHIEVDRNVFTLLLYHRPRGLADAAEAGVNLMLSGHTHNGQIMPFNLLVGRVFDMVKGMYRQGDARMYVSQGTGTWGPVMRIGTQSEITLFEISPEQP